jgi:alcohol dehydrogenase class IV
LSTDRLRKFYAPEFIFGDGSLTLAGQYAEKLGITKALVVTDAGVAAAGWTAKVVEAVEASGIGCAVFSDLTPNPKDNEVMAGAEFYRAEACDGLIAVGGGSPMDCAKGIGIVVSNGRPVLAFEGVDAVDAPMPPMLCVATTAGTAADISQFAIITNTRERRKIAIVSKAVVPDLSLLDPRTLTTMDSALRAATGLDALTHAVEAFVSTGCSAVTDLHAQQGIRLVRRHLLASIRNPEDLEEAAGMHLASLEAGLAFSNASLGAVHAMAHSLGGLLDLPHGVCNAILLSHVLEFNYPATPRRCSLVAEALGVDEGKLSGAGAPGALSRAVAEFREAAGVGHRLSEMGVSARDIPLLAQNAMRDACIVTNPRVPSQSDLEAIYERAL